MILLRHVPCMRPPLVLHLTTHNYAFSTVEYRLLAFGFSRLSDSGPRSHCLAAAVRKRCLLQTIRRR